MVHRKRALTSLAVGVCVIGVVGVSQAASAQLPGPGSVTVRSGDQTIEPRGGAYCWAPTGEPGICVDPPHEPVPTRREELRVGRGDRIVVRFDTPAEAVDVRTMDDATYAEARGSAHRWTFRARHLPPKNPLTIRLDVTYAPGKRPYYLRLRRST